MTMEFESLTIEISLPANRDFVGSLKVWSDQGQLVAGPFPIAARTSDEIAADHGNPTRITTLPYGDPPIGTYKYGRKAATGDGSRLRQDLFGSKDVIVLLPTGGPAALGDANGRFEIFIHGGPRAANGGLRATSGHFRISDHDLELLGDIVERSGRITCVCVETAVAGRVVVAGLGPAESAAKAKPDRPRRKPKPLVPYEALVAFGEYAGGDVSPDPVVDTSLSSPALLAFGIPDGAACMGKEICQNMQDAASLATVADTDPYTGGPANFDASADNPFNSWQIPFYPSGQSPFYPNGQNVNPYNGPPANDSTPQPGNTNVPSALAPGVVASSVAASLPLTNLPATSLTSLSTASPFGNGSNPFIPGSVPRLESANAWASASPSQAAQSAIEEQIRLGFLDPSFGVPGANISTATAQTSRSITTSIRAQTAEMSGYDARLAMGEIGIIAPSGSNVPGLDYFTVTRLPNGGYSFNIVDMKSRVSANQFGQVPGSLPGDWRSTADTAIEKLNLGNPQLEQAIQNEWAVQRGTVVPIRDTMDFGPLQGGRVTALPGNAYSGGLSVNGTPVPLDRSPSSVPTGQPSSTVPVSEPSPTMPLGGRLLAGGMGLAGSALSAYALQDALANGQWFSAGVNAASFVSSSLIAGGAAAGSSALLQAGQTFGVATAPLTAAYSGYAFQNDLANGQWLAAAADASSFASSALMFGGWLAESAALTGAGEVIGAFAAGWAIGSMVDQGLQSLTESAFGVDLSPSALIAGQLTFYDNILTSLWADDSQPRYTQTLGWKLAQWLD